jgi:hypothetical protein
VVREVRSNETGKEGRGKIEKKKKGKEEDIWLS